VHQKGKKMRPTIGRIAARELAEKFGSRYTEDRIEVELYSHDMGEMPGFVEKLVRPHAAAVVRAASAEEVADLLRLARRHGFSVTPRAAATSGYGGAVPVAGGVVLDLTLLNRIREADEEGMTVLAEAGVVWNDLEKELRDRGLALRTYPSSAPSSTVGGWVAEGGSGIGAFAYGHLVDSLAGLEVVSPEGELLWVEGDDLDLFYGAEGITGIVTAARLKVRVAGEETPLLFSFDGPEQIARFAASLKGLPLFHLQALNPRLAEEKNAVSEAEPLPVAWLALAVLENPHPELERSLEEAAAAAGGTPLPRKEARHEWEERFRPMRIRRLGPSLIPAEAMMPVEGLPGFLADLERRLPEMGLEAVYSADGSAALLGFIPADARSLSFSLEFAKSLRFLGLALEHGGKPYGTGLYFAARYRQRWGEEKASRLRSYKSERDPRGLLNPGKLLTGPGRPPRLRLLDLMLSAALPFSGPAGRLSSLLPSRPLRESGRLPRELEEAAYRCAQCGYCVDGCSLYSGKGWESASPRGKWYFLKRYDQGKLPMTQQMAEKFLLCTTCKKCDPVCQTDLPIESLWGELRGELVASGRFHTFPPFEMMGTSYDLENNIWAGFSAERDAWLPQDIEVKEGCELAYWAGCTASYVEKDIARGAARILQKGGIDFAYLGKDETCCGVPFFMSGKWDVFEKAVRRNIEEVNRRGIRTLVTSCPGCWVTLNHHYREWAEKLGLEWDVEVRHISQLAAELVEQGKLRFEKELPLKVTWHDPCHIGRHGGIYEEPRRVLQAIPGLELREMEHNREEGLCCGSVLTLIGDTHPTSENIALQRLREARVSGAEVIATTCPCCEFQLRVWSEAAGDGMPVRDFASIVGQALGEELEDPTPEVIRNWAVFEKMIEMMTPAGMASFMGEFMSGLPGGKAALRLLRLIPRPIVDIAAGLAGRLMPRLAPWLLPPALRLMLPRMMPLMERRMPEMSEAMRRLMPQMLPEVMLKVMPPLAGPMLRELAGSPAA
jgi:Fe-S oxidoreductase/FAD/FMN-containing dehydrogenase